MPLDVLELVYQRLQLFVIAKYFLNNSTLSFGVVERMEVNFVHQLVRRQLLLDFNSHVRQIRNAMRVADFGELKRNLIFRSIVCLNQLFNRLVVDFVMLKQLS